MGSFTNDQALAQRCNKVTEAVRRARGWQSETSIDAAQSNLALERALRKAVVQGVKLEQASLRKSCVAVFGASQAGKSYLISALARKGPNRLMAKYDDHLIDFIAELNPEGGQEATGVVTRFTMDAPASVPAGHPVQLGLLSETDVVRILANSYVFDLLDVDAGEDDGADRVSVQAEAIRNSLEGLRNAGEAQSPISVEDVYELEDYFSKQLGPTNNTRVLALKRSGFWEIAEEVLPRAGVDDRMALYALMWEELGVFTKICKRLLLALAALGNPREVFCSAEALFDVSGDEWTRSSRSMVNVSALRGIGDETGDKVSVKTVQGASAMLERAELTALVAELITVISEQPHDFFDTTDLLDFPGARTRKPVAKIDSVLDEVSTRTENFLRGKVAYLFERYCAEQELTSMILTVGPSNQEVATLAKMVEDWVISTHGQTPEERRHRDNALFFVLSKFDMEFERGAGKSLDASRWTTRIEASLLKPFGGPHSARTDWVSNWDGSGAFKNVFWIRNPNIRSDGLFNYEGDAQNFSEKGLKDEDTESFVGSLRDSYLSCPEVKAHFQEPDAAWAAGMQLDDGGVSRLAKALAPVCRPELKRSQVEHRLERLCQGILSELSTYYVSGDLETVLNEKKELAKALLPELVGCLRSQKLGQLMTVLRVDENAMIDIYLNAERLAASSTDSSTTGVTSAAGPADDLLAQLGLPDEATNGSSGATDDNGAVATAEEPRKDVAERFVSDLEAVWLENVHAVAENSQYLTYFSLKRETLLKMASELVLSARRLGVFERMVEAVRYEYQFKIPKRSAWVWKQVTPACAIFNQFISFMGCRATDTSNPVVVRNLQGADVEIFKPIAPVVDELKLEPQASNYETAYFMDWLMALQHQIRDNAEFQIGFAGDANDNAKLGEILSVFEIPDDS